MLRLGRSRCAPPSPALSARRRGALRHRTPSTPGACGAGGQDGRGRAAIAPEQDQDRVLQGGQRTGAYEHTAFTFLGFTFRARGARRKNGTGFTSFLPAVSTDAMNKMSATVRSWRLHRRTSHGLSDLARGDQPDHPWMDGLLRRLLPIGVASPLVAHQRLPAALDPTEVPTAAALHQGTTSLDTGHHPRPGPLRPLAMVPHRLVTRTTGAV